MTRQQFTAIVRSVRRIGSIALSLFVALGFGLSSISAFLVGVWGIPFSPLILVALPGCCCLVLYSLLQLRPEAKDAIVGLVGVGLIWLGYSSYLSSIRYHDLDLLFWIALVVLSVSVFIQTVSPPRPDPK